MTKTLSKQRIVDKIKAMEKKYGTDRTADSWKIFKDNLNIEAPRYADKLESNNPATHTVDTNIRCYLRNFGNFGRSPGNDHAWDSDLNNSLSHLEIREFWTMFFAEFC